MKLLCERKIDSTEIDDNRHTAVTLIQKQHSLCDPVTASCYLHFLDVIH